MYTYVYCNTILVLGSMRMVHVRVLGVHVHVYVPLTAKSHSQTWVLGLRRATRGGDVRIWMELEIDQILACGERWSVVERRTALLLGAAGAERVERIDTCEAGSRERRGVLVARSDGTTGRCPSCAGVRRVPCMATRPRE